MPVITCPECGGKVSTTTDVCIHCGYKLNKEENVTTQDPPNVRRKSFPKWILFTGIAIVSLFAVATALYFTFDVNDYINGTRARNLGDYKLAIQLFDKTRVPWKETLVEQTKQQTYDKAAEMITAQKWSDAVDLLTGLDFQDSEELLVTSTRNQGMAEKADFSFLAALRESITRRMEINAKESSDYRTLVNTELAYVEKYDNEEFFDGDLKILAQKYISGLHTQLKSLDADLQSDYQIEWQKGLVEREEVLCVLYEKYDFMKDNKDFEGTYVANLEEDQNLLVAYQAVDSDLGRQFDINEWSYKSNYLSCTYKNNTRYSYSTVFDFTFYDKNDTIIDNRSVTIENVKPGDNFVVSVYVAYPTKVDHWIWQYYYPDVS